MMMKSNKNKRKISNSKLSKIKL